MSFYQLQDSNSIGSPDCFTGKHPGNSTAEHVGNSAAEHAGNSTAEEVGNSAAEEVGNSTAEQLDFTAEHAHIVGAYDRFPAGFAPLSSLQLGWRHLLLRLDKGRRQLWPKDRVPRLFHGLYTYKPTANFFPLDS